MIVNFIEFDNEGRLKVNPELYTISPFSLLLKEIPISNPEHINVVSYIYWSGLVGSFYFLNVIEKDVIATTEASNKIKEDVGLPLTWTPSPTVYSCIDKWKELQQTPSLLALKSTSDTIKALRSYLDGINLNETVQAGKLSGQLLHDPIKITNIGIKLDVLTETYMKREKVVIAEYSEKMKIRGGGVMGLRENR